MTNPGQLNSSSESGQCHALSKENGDKCEMKAECKNHRDVSHFFEKKTIRKVKAIAGHVGLLVTLMLYTAAGGLVFRHIELPAELSRLEQLRLNLRSERSIFVKTISNNTDVSNLATLVSVKLRAYEEAVQEAAQAGLLVSLVTEAIEQDDMGVIDLPPITTERWSPLQAVFFASTVLTTIGYGNLVPSTNWGRVFCILFAIVGIPLTMIVIADWGKLFASAVVHVALIVKSKLSFGTINTYLPSNLAGRRSLGAFAAIVLLFLYLACGAGMFMLWETEWDFFDGFYFCFVTMTTIGFGDLVPKPKYTLLCTLYILVGLALTGTIIELVRRQYAQSWRRLQALRGPLADTIRRLGEHAGGDMSAFHSDLRRMLTVITVPRLRWASSVTTREDVKEEDWEEAVEAVLRDIATTAKSETTDNPIVQIVVYESSV